MSNKGNASEITYTVSSDLLDVSGPPTLTIPANGEGTYVLTVTPSRGGSVLGMISFTTRDRQVLWYTLEVEAAPPEPEEDLALSCSVRKAVVADIKVANPLDETGV